MKRNFVDKYMNTVMNCTKTSIKVKSTAGSKIVFNFRNALSLAILIFSIPLISACSEKQITDTTSPAATTSTPSATPLVSASPSTPAATEAPTPEPTSVPSAETSTVPTPVPSAEIPPAPAALPLQFAIAATSEELSEKGFEEYNQFNYDAAIKYFDSAIREDSNNYKAYTGKGITLCFKGNYSAGMPLIQKALDLKPDYSYGYYSMAMAYKLQKDYDNTLIYFNKALALDPKDTWSYYGIATIYADRGDINTSLDYLKKAIDLEPSVKDVAKEQDHFEPYLNNEEFQKLVD